MAAPENINNVVDHHQCPDSDTEPVKLSDLLDRGWKLFEEVDATHEPSGSSPVQAKVKRALLALEDASRMVAQVALFSRNEEMEELATADLKYLLLPALLGALTVKQSGREQRLEHVRGARLYFYDFLRRCKEYNVSDFELPDRATSENSPDSPDESDSESSNKLSVIARPPDLLAMAVQRQAKIERYRQKKETEVKLSEVKAAVDSGRADDELVRDFYLLNIRRWISVSLEEIESIDQEVEILKRMDVLRRSSAEPSSSRSKQPARPPMKPFILTKDAAQARVFGAGYPSLPTMTVDDWYEQHRMRGALPDQGIPQRVATEEEQEEDFEADERDREEKEKRLEQDDEEALQKARDWDEWKETHQRGYGNRHNMG